MEDYRVNLKNIYRLIRINDYPVYSNGVISRSRQKGLTLVKFWKELLLYRWRNTTHGRIIWRTEGSKNRYHSELCNRKHSFPFYREYTIEILNLITIQEVADQIELFSSFLEGRKYSHDNFRKKLERFLQFASGSDEIFRKEAADYFNGALAFYDYGQLPDLFVDSWFMTMLSLHAISGVFMNIQEMSKLRNDMQFLPDQIKLFVDRSHERIPEGNPFILTEKDSILWNFSLSQDNFYGRDQEIFDLKDAARTNHKLLLTGVSGSGKTELLRQLLMLIIQYKKPMRIATIQYESGLENSFARFFTDISGINVHERFKEIIRILSSDQDHNTVVMIDNLKENNADLEVVKLLAQLPCTVLITSEVKELPGFETYKLDEIDLRAASLIFRNNSGRILSSSEKASLNQLLSITGIRHPLTLALLGKTFGTLKFSIEELFNIYQRTDSISTVHTDNYPIPEQKLRSGCKNLYLHTGLKKVELSQLRFISVLPYRHYDKDFLLHITGLDSRSENISVPDKLFQSGWLERSNGNYSIHPLIAASIRKKKYTEQEFTLLFQLLEEQLNFSFEEFSEISNTQIDAARLILHVANIITSPVSENLALLCEQSSILLYKSGQVSSDNTV